MSRGPGSSHHSKVDIFAVFALVRNAYIADTLSRQRQGLGVGIADDGVVIDIRNERNNNISVYKFSVWFVSYDIDWMTILFALLS